MEINKAHCLFEQSGTFKNAFKKLGIDAEDYDILNSFGETDHQIDLFAEIQNAYIGKPSIFDGIKKDDVVVAFFPCTRFESRVPLILRGEQFQMQKWTDSQKLENSIKTHDELHLFYTLLCKLFLVSIRGGWPMIVENPYMQPHYLTQFFPIKPKVIIKDRNKEGDYFKKPTQFFFVNCEPEQNVVFAPIEPITPVNVDDAQRLDVSGTRAEKRSLMHPQFVERFIKTYIVSKEGGVWLQGE